MIVVEQMALADAAEQLALQRKAFLPPYARYRDEGSPIFTPESEMIRRIEDPCGVSLKILVDGIAAGGHLHRSGFPMPWSRSYAFGTARKGATGYPALVAQSSQGGGRQPSYLREDGLPKYRPRVGDQRRLTLLFIKKHT